MTKRRSSDLRPVLLARGLPGPGKGKVTFEVQQGDTIAAMGRSLKTQGVVASVDAFTAAAAANPDSTGIQVGFYQLKKEMPAVGRRSTCSSTRPTWSRTR